MVVTVASSGRPPSRTHVANGAGLPKQTLYPKQQSSTDLVPCGIVSWALESEVYEKAPGDELSIEVSLLLCTGNGVVSGVVVLSKPTVSSEGLDVVLLY